MSDSARKAAPKRSGILQRLLHAPWLLYGVLAFCAGIALYLAGVLLVFPRYLLSMRESLDSLSQWLVWYSGVPIVVGLLFALLDLLILFERKRSVLPLRQDAVRCDRLTVALTAFNDAQSIALAVKDFAMHPLVHRVIVVSNNSTDATLQEAALAGAVVFDEPRQGYGYCVVRCLHEALRHAESDVFVLCEGDRTFRAADLGKLVAYASHGDIVNGTRTVEALRERATQLSTFIFYGNFFVGKLLEAKHLGRGTITDVGTTYKLCRLDALRELLPHLQAEINLEFNAHFLDRTLEHRLRVIECPITFHARVGVSKGGNVNNWRALKVGLRMICGIVFGWRRFRVH